MVTKQTFLKGAMILAIANIFVKLIGAFYTIPLARLIGPEGMGLYSSAYQIYMWLFIISTTGFPIAISKLVSENIALGRRWEAHRIFRISLMLLVILGLFSTMVLYNLADKLVSVIGTKRSYFSVIAISPCLFFVSVMSAFRGYFQGLQNMIPTAISQLLEALTKAVVGLILAHFLLIRGIEYSAAGAILGVSFGGLLGMFLLIIIYFSKRKSILKKIKIQTNKVKMARIQTIITNLVKIALPITLGASVFSISNIIDLSMIMRRLRHIGFSEDYAIKLYGYLTGYAYKIYIVPSTVIIAIAISIVPILSAAYARRNKVKIEKIINISLKWALVFSIPAATGIGILSKEILYLLFKDSNASNILRVLCFAIILVTTVQVSSAILQGVGKAMVPVKNLFIGAGLKIITNYILLGIPSINILGASISTTICYFVVTILNLIQIKKLLKIKNNFIKLFIKPLVASIGMAIIVLNLYNYIFKLFNSNSISVFVSIIGGFITYGVLILLVGGIDKSDLESMPLGDKITYYLSKINVIK